MVDLALRVAWTARWWLAGGLTHLSVARVWRASGVYVSTMRSAGFKVLT